MTAHLARGTFTTKMSNHPAMSLGGGVEAGHSQVDKVWSGDIQGTSTVHMLGLLNRELGSGAYVALERVEGTVGVKKGSFCLVHSATMNRGAPGMVIAVVPDSGTGELQGIAGMLRIDIVEGVHHYTLETAS